MKVSEVVTVTVWSGPGHFSPQVPVGSLLGSQLCVEARPGCVYVYTLWVSPAVREDRTSPLRVLSHLILRIAI